MRSRLFEMAGKMIGVAPDDLELLDGNIRSRVAPERHVSVVKVVEPVHWDEAA